MILGLRVHRQVLPVAAPVLDGMSIGEPHGYLFRLSFRLLSFVRRSDDGGGYSAYRAGSGSGFLAVRLSVGRPGRVDRVEVCAAFSFCGRAGDSVGDLPDADAEPDFSGDIEVSVSAGNTSG